MNNRGDLINGAVLGSGNNVPNVRFGASQISCGAFVGPYIDPDPGISAKPRLRAAGISLVGSIAGRASATSKGSRRLVGKLSATAATSAIPQRRIGRLRGAVRVTATASLELFAKGMRAGNLPCTAACSGGFHPEFDELVGAISGTAYLRGRLASIDGFSFSGYGGAAVRGQLAEATSFSFSGYGGAAVRGQLAEATSFSFSGCGSASVRGQLATTTSFSFYEQGNASVRGLLTGGEIYYG